MDELVTWLRAQIDEDERLAQAALSTTSEGGWHWARISPRSTRFVPAVDPVRVLREVKARRLLLDFLDPSDAPAGEGRYVAERAVLLLALPYADRPGYQEEWRPR